MESVSGNAVTRSPADTVRLRPTWWARLLSCGLQDRQEWVGLTLAFVVLFCLRLPFLPPTLDDIDGINFDLGVHGYNPAAFRPHPPGYPVFILLAKLSHAFFTSHAAALAFLSVLFGALAVFPLYLLTRELTGRAGGALACFLTLASPLVWFDSVRPMSDATGLFAVLASQCLLLKGARAMDRDARHGRLVWYLGVVVAGLTIGIRAQALFLVGPILMYGSVRHSRIRLGSAAWLVASVTTWLAPMIYLSGGAAAYVRSLTLLIVTALPVEPLLSAPTPHRAAYALWDALGAPWGTPWLAVPILLLSAIGAIRLIFWNRSVLAWALLLFLPYTIYHYLLQSTATIRYAIPIVPCTALLAGVPFADRKRPPTLLAMAFALAFIAISWGWTWPALAAYHRTSSPAAQALARLRGYAMDSDDFVISGHHVFERYLSRLETNFTVLPSVPRQAWTPLMDYWKAGGRKPILFLRNPKRSTLLLMGRDAQTSLGGWSWPGSVQPLMKGERPSSVELVRLDPPEWFAESGFLVTREVGLPDEVAREEHRVYVRPSPRHRTLIVSGSLLDARETQVGLQLGGTIHRQWHLQRDFTLRAMLDPMVDRHYVPLSLVSPVPVLFTDVSVENEDRPVMRPAKGFYSPEQDGQGRRFRWMAPEATAEAYVPGKAARLRIRGRIPIKYYRLPVTILLNWNGKPLASIPIATAEFNIDSPVPAPVGHEPWGTLRITSSQHFVPDDWQKNGDRRTLAAQIYELTLSGPASISEPH